MSPREISYAGPGWVFLAEFSAENWTTCGIGEPGNFDAGPSNHFLAERVVLLNTPSLPPWVKATMAGFGLRLGEDIYCIYQGLRADRTPSMYSLASPKVRDGAVRRRSARALSYHWLARRSKEWLYMFPPSSYQDQYPSFIRGVLCPWLM
jgi:hypothetical protein